MAQPKAARLIKSFAMPVDATVFSGVPSVTALKPLPSADVLLAAAMDRRVVSCDLKADSPKRIPAKHLGWSHDNWVHSLDVHPDGERVVTGGADRRIKVWKWGEETPLGVLEVHDDWVRSVAFSPDGKRIASAGDDGVGRLWNILSPNGGMRRVGTVTTLEGQGSFFDTLAWTPDSNHLIGSGNDGKLYIWEVGIASAKLARTIDIDNRRNIEDEPLNGGFSYPGGVRRLTVSPDGKRIGAVGLTSLCVLDLDGKKQMEQAGRAFGVAFDAEGKRLAWSQEKDLLVWDFAAGGVTHKIVVDQLGLFGICFLAGGQQLVSGGCNGWVGIWDLSA